MTGVLTDIVNDTATEPKLRKPLPLKQVAAGLSNNHVIAAFEGYDADKDWEEIFLIVGNGVSSIQNGVRIHDIESIVIAERMMGIRNSLIKSPYQFIDVEESHHTSNLRTRYYYVTQKPEGSRNVYDRYALTNISPEEYHSVLGNLKSPKRSDVMAGVKEGITILKNRAGLDLLHELMIFGSPIARFSENLRLDVPYYINSLRYKLFPSDSS